MLQGDLTGCAYRQRELIDSSPQPLFPSPLACPRRAKGLVGGSCPRTSPRPDTPITESAVRPRSGRSGNDEDGWSWHGSKTSDSTWNTFQRSPTLTRPRERNGLRDATPSL